MESTERCDLKGRLDPSKIDDIYLYMYIYIYIYSVQLRKKRPDYHIIKKLVPRNHSTAKPQYSENLCTLARQSCYVLDLQQIIAMLELSTNPENMSDIRQGDSESKFLLFP